MLAQQLVNGIVLGSIYALMALGYTMVYGILMFINFAHGDIYMFGAFVGLWLAGGGRLGFATVVLGSMIGAAALGLAVERLAYKPLRGAPRLSPLLSAIGVSVFLENSFIKYLGPAFRPFPQLVQTTTHKLGDVAITSLQIYILVTTVILMVCLTLFIRKSRLGKAIRATSENRAAAGLMGINTDRAIAITFLIGSLLAGAAGTMVGLYFNAVYPLMGWMPGMKGFVAAVLGGIGEIPGAVLGGLVLGVAEVLAVGYIASSYRDAVAFSILIAILLWRPWGLLGRPSKVNL